MPTFLAWRQLVWSNSHKN